MRCERCGYDDNGTGDNAHVCLSNGTEVAKFWGFDSVEDWNKFLENGGMKTKYAKGGIIDGVRVVGNGGKEHISISSAPLNTEDLIHRTIKGLPVNYERTRTELNIETKEKVDPNNASRFDSGKVDWSQVPFQALEGMVRVLEFGAKKYSKGNWASGGGFDHSRVFNSLIRHFVSYQSGEDNDSESGLPHIDHMMCNCMFMAFYKRYPDIFNKDDRIKWVSQNI